MVSIEIRDKFKKLYKEKFDITLNDEEATQMATDLVNLIQILIKPEEKTANDNQAREERRGNEIISI